MSTRFSAASASIAGANYTLGDVAKLLEYLLSDSPRARSSPTLAIPPTLLARADEVTE